MFEATKMFFCFFFALVTLVLSEHKTENYIANVHAGDEGDVSYFLVSLPTLSNQNRKTNSSGRGDGLYY